MRVKGKVILPNCPKCRRKMKHQNPKAILHSNIYHCLRCNITIMFRDVSFEYVEEREKEAQ